MKAKRVATFGIFVALAFLLSYIETIIPIPIPIPGIKLGLANLVVLAGLYTLGPKEAFVLSVVRILLVGLSFNPSALMFSLGGGMLSCFLMIIFSKTKSLSTTGVSIVGGVSHNIGQIIVAAWVVNNILIVYYLPFLLISGAVTGALIGLIGSNIINRIKKFNINS